jgi:recombination protein RecR
MPLPSPIQRLIEHFNKLPGVGPKTSERFAYHFLKQPHEEIEAFTHALLELKNAMTLCRVCFDLSEKNPCARCSDPLRDHSLVCVVAESQDIPPLDRTGYRGLYHVLGGVINTIEQIGPQQLHISELLSRIQSNGIQEVILATNPDLEGESTALFLAKQLQSLPARVTRIARGLPMGASLEYADDVTLRNALEGRRAMTNNPKL